MKRFLVFTYYVGRPLGGIHDFLQDFASVQEAVDNILPERHRYYQIVDSSDMSVVKQGLAMYKNFSPTFFEKHPSPARSPRQ